MRIVSTVVLALVLSIGWTTSAHSQLSDVDRSHTEGLFFNAHLNAQGISVEDEDGEGGLGGGLKVGYGFTPLFTLYGGVDVASMDVETALDPAITQDSYTLAHVDIGGQLNFRVGPNATVPYLDGSLTGFAAVYSTDPDISLSGIGGSVGGGIKYFFSPQFAFDGGLHFTIGQYDELEVGSTTTDVDLSVVTARINVGLAWYPFR